MLGAALLLVACGSDQPPDFVATADLGTIDGRPAPPRRTPDRLTAIPDQFRGRWAAGGIDCGPLSDGVMIVAGSELRFTESTATPSYILREGPPAIALELAFISEGETWTETTTLRLTPNDRLSRRDPNGREVMYHRCPAEPAR